MAQLIFRNTSASTALEVADLGIYLEAGEDTDLILNFRDEDLLESTDLATAMAGTGKVYLNGVTEFNYATLIDYLTHLTRYDTIDYAYISAEDANTDVTALELESLTNGSDVTLHIHDNRYYTKTNMQTSGQSAVHWGNITNAPAFGAPSWREPVKCMLSGKGTTAQMNASSPASGWFWWNTDDNIIYKYVSSAWVAGAAPVSGDRVVFRDGTGSNDYIYQHNGSTWGTGIIPEDNWAVMVNDDGDGKAAQYIYDINNAPPNWIKIADVDWYQANAIAVTPTGNISSTNVQAALEELQGDINSISSSTVSLDSAYNYGSVITVDTTNVDWNLTDGRDFTVTANAGALDILNVAAASGGDSVTINGTLTSNGAFTLNGTGNSTITTASGNLTISTSTAGNISIASIGNVTLKDQYLSAAIPLSQSGTTGLAAGFVATSIIGAINEAYNNTIGSDTLDEIYDGETGTRLVHQDNGSVEWQISDTYEHNFADAAGADILSVKALATGDIVRVNGNLDVNGGVVTIDATTASNFTVTGADLTLSTVTTGDINIAAAVQLDIDAANLDADFVGAFNIDGGGNSAIRTTAANLTIATATSGNIAITSVGALTLDDQYLSAPLALSESGETALDVSYIATSIVGALNELKTDLDNVVVTLDEAYDGLTGSGSGRTITADSGAVVINASTVTTAPLQLTPQTVAPSTNVAAGQMTIIGGDLYIYDSTRAKWLSHETHYVWGEESIKGKIMKVGDALGSDVGFKVPVNATIVKVTASEASGSTRAIHLRKNSSTTAIKNFSLVAGAYISTNDNIDLAAGDILQAFVPAGTGNAAVDLVVNVYIKYRA